MKPAASISAKRKNTLYNKPHIFKPDLDNLIKYICDICSNNVIYQDDCIIASITAKKVYSELPRTEFTLMEIK